MEKDTVKLLLTASGVLAIYSAPWWGPRLFPKFFQKSNSTPSIENPPPPTDEPAEVLECSNAIVRRLQRAGKVHDGSENNDHGDGHLTGSMSPLIRSRPSKFPAATDPSAVADAQPAADVAPTELEERQPQQGKKKKKHVRVCVERNVVISSDGDTTKRAVSGASAVASAAPVAPAHPFIEALRGGASAQMLKQMAAEKGIPQRDPQSGRSVLHDCAESLVPGQESIVSLLVEEFGMDLTAEDSSNGWITAPMYACAAGKESIAVEFIKACQKMNCLDHMNKSGWSAMHVAAGRNRGPIVQALLAAGASANQLNPQGSTPLHVALVAGAKDAALSLVAGGADPTIPDKTGATPLHLCMLHGFSMYSLASELLARGANVNAVDESCATPLHWALRRGHGRLSALLIVNNADVTLGDSPHHVTPLHLAASAGDSGMLSTFIKNRPSANLDVIDSFGRSPMIVACMNGKASTVGILAEGGANVDIVDAGGATALLWALRRGHKDAAQKLCDHNARFDVRDQYKNTALLMACFKGKPFAHVAAHIAEKRPMDVSVADEKGRFPLHWAAAHGDAMLCTTLVDAGASWKVRDSEQGVLPIHWAAFNAQPNAVEILIREAIASGLTEPEAANVEDHSKRTPLHWLCKKILSTTTNSKTNANENEYNDEEEEVANHVESIDSAQFQRVLEFLVVNHGDLDAGDKDGVTPKELLRGTPFYDSLDGMVKRRRRVSAPRRSSDRFVAFPET